jgi:hypothetical protein
VRFLSNLSWVVSPSHGDYQMCREYLPTCTRGKRRLLNVSVRAERRLTMEVQSLEEEIKGKGLSRVGFI